MRPARRDAPSGERASAPGSSAAVSVVQFLLLAGIIWGSENQLRRRLNAEATARQAVERRALIVATVREPIAVIAPDLKIVTCNQAFTDYYALERDDVLDPTAPRGTIRRCCSGCAMSR